MEEPSGRQKNFYQELKNDPETVRKREEKRQRLNKGIQNVLNGIYKRKPSWSKSDILRMDMQCLRNGERCIMWDDAGAGFYMLLRWDWIKNEPEFLDHHENGRTDRLYSTVASMLKPPFLDTSLPRQELARWIDEKTVTIHYKLLPHIHEIRRSKDSKYMYELPDENTYWQDLLRQAGEIE